MTSSPGPAPQYAPNAQRRGETPTISVVVASNRDRSLLEACVASLIGQCQRASADIIVARAGSDAEVALLRNSMPNVRFLPAPPAATIPELRALGMEAARGDIVALTEDHCVADPAWVETLLAHSRDAADVIGGGMGNAQRGRAVDWGAYFAEYGFFADTRPETGGERPLLTGANVAYKRRVIDDVVAWAREGEWENVAHTRLAARGSTLRFVGTAAVYQNKNYTLASFCVDRYEHGRDYARKRLAEEHHSGARRWLLFLASPALPALLTWRIAKAASRSRRSTFLRALPATFLFLSAWSLGEAVGYLRGPSSDSTESRA
jgi:GT2 family glycosyltransferase